MNNSLPDIDFTKIRTFQKSQNKGFEELSVQLFRTTFVEGTEFYRVDDKGGDGGVEDIAISSGNEKIGMQAKYFTSLTQTQWTQISTSVKTAIKTHAPDLIEYRIYTPQNRSKNTKTWENYKVKWNDYARSENEYDHDIRFCWVGETELRDELIKEKHRERLLYWFDFQSFGSEWLTKEFNKSKAAIDNRYTPQLHIRTSIESQLNAFCLNDRFKDVLIKKFKVLKDSIDKFCKYSKKLSVEDKSSIEIAIASINTIFRNMINIPSFEILCSMCTKIMDILKLTRKFYYKLQLEHPDYKPNSYTSNPYDYELMLIRKAIENCAETFEFLLSYEVYDKQFLLLRGEAGTGKSHIMTSLVESCLGKGQSALLFIGEQFNSGESPQNQMNSIIGWDGNFNSMLQILEQDAKVKQKPSLILIDALNESGYKKIWKNHLLSLIEEIKGFPNIRILISCRSDFLQFVLPESLSRLENPEFGYIEHHGFDLNFSEAVETYFKGYQVLCDHFPPLIEEFRNPLFLKTFCEAYAGKKIPSGPLGLDSVMEARMDQCRKELVGKLDCPKYIINDAVEVISKEIQENDGIGISQEKVQREMDALFHTSGVSNSLYMGLKSNGLIVETYIRDELVVRFPYERFSDYLIAKRMLAHLKKRDLKNGWRKKHGLFYKYLTEPYKYRNLLRMLAILIPDNYKIELINLINEPFYIQILHKIPLLKKAVKKENPDYIYYYADFWESLVWRSADSITDSTDNLVQECFNNLSPDVMLNGLFRMATIPKHPYNAIFLNEYIKGFTLSQLEYNWTIPVSNLTGNYGPNSIESFIEWVFNVSPNQVDNNQAWLAALSLTWLLSSNNKGLRKRVSLALIKLLIGRVELVVKLIEEFHDCVDPYIQERVYAAACGVVLQEANINKVKLLTSTVYRYVFSGDIVPPNILIRDNALTIMEYAKYKKALPPNVDLKKITPPFRSDWPGFSDVNDLKDRYSRDGWDTIRSSLQPEKTGAYGDFGRYVMESAVHHFSNQSLNETYTHGKRYENILDGENVGNFIFNRVRVLGWNPVLFGEYESTLKSGRLRIDEEESKIERISKKYQWIGLYELLGYLADNYWLHSDYDDEEPHICRGAEPFFIRGFDPSQPLKDPKENIAISEYDDNSDFSYDKINLLNDNFSDEILLLNRDAWVTTPPKDFAPLLEEQDEDENGWLILAGHFHQEEDLKIFQDESVVGRTKLWVDIRCWLIKKEDLDTFTDYVKNIQMWGNGCSYIELHNSRLGEYPWANNCQWIRNACNESPSWLGDCPVDVISTECQYNNEYSQQGFLPCPQIIELFNLNWSGEGFNYCDENGEKIAKAIPADDIDESYLYIKKDIFIERVKSAGYIPVWAALSEKSCYSSKSDKSIVPKWAITQRIYGESKGSLFKIDDKNYDIPLYR